MPQMSDLVSIVQNAPRVIWDHQFQTQDAFSCFMPQDYRPTSSSIAELIALGERMNIGGNRMDWVDCGYGPIELKVSSDGARVYVTGIIKFDDPETLDALRYFDIGVEPQQLNSSGGYPSLQLYSLKNVGDAVQFFARGNDWGSRPGHAHLCLGHVPYR